MFTRVIVHFEKKFIRRDTFKFSLGGTCHLLPIVEIYYGFSIHTLQPRTSTHWRSCGHFLLLQTAMYRQLQMQKKECNVQ